MKKASKIQQAFGVVLKKARINARMSQEQLALEADLDRTFVSLLERGLRQPTLTSVFRLSAALKASPSQLIYELEKKLS